MKYEVTIRYTITKTYHVEADTESDAIEITYDNGSILSEPNIDENYNEEIISVDHYSGDDKLFNPL